MFYKGMLRCNNVYIVLPRNRSMKRITIQNQAEQITVKPKTKLFEIGLKIYEIGYHYKRFVGLKSRNEKIIWI